MYQTQISIHSVISISLTQKISDIKFLMGRCQDIANSCTFNKLTFLISLIFFNSQKTAVTLGMPCPWRLIQHWTSKVCLLIGGKIGNLLTYRFISFFKVLKTLVCCIYDIYWRLLSNNIKLWLTLCNFWSSGTENKSQKKYQTAKGKIWKSGGCYQWAWTWKT